MSDPQPPTPGPGTLQLSLTGPVLFLAFASAFVLSMPVMFGAASVPVFCAQNCCGGLTVSLLGILPVRMVWRYGGVLSPGLGFVIPLLGVFMGGVISAIVQVGVAPLPTAELRDNANQFFEMILADFERRGESTDHLQRGAFVDAFLFCGRYGVLLVAAGSAVCAGGIGCASALAVRRFFGSPPKDAASGSEPGAGDDPGPEAD